MARLPEIRLPGLRIPILHEDRAIIAIDKPAGWQLAPENARRVANNLHMLLMGSIINGDRWSSSRGIRFLRHVHRLDEDTSGVLILGRSKGAVAPLSQLFADGRVGKAYLAVVNGHPSEPRWISRLALNPFDTEQGKVFAGRRGKPAETRFTVLASTKEHSLIACQPITGRTHQIRVHLAESGHPITGDSLYNGGERRPEPFPIGLRAVAIELIHPFARKKIHITTEWNDFVKRFGFDSRAIDFNPRSMTGSALASKRTQSRHGRQERQKEEKGQRQEVQKGKAGQKIKVRKEAEEKRPQRKSRQVERKDRKRIQDQSQRMPRRRSSR